MGRVVAIGESGPLDGLALVGVHVCTTTGDDDVLAAWHGLGEDVELVVLTRAAADLLGSWPVVDGGPLVVVTP